MLQLSKVASEKAEAVFEAAKEATVSGYKAVENGAVKGYKAIENAVVGTYTKIEDAFVGTFLKHEGETVAEAKARVRSQIDAGNHGGESSAQTPQGQEATL